jgi:single-stranded DNA-binding protein
LNITHAVGRVGEIHPLGDKGIRFGLACDEWNAKAGEKKTTWLPCVAWEKDAERINTYVGKGGLVALDLKFEMRDGTDGKSYPQFRVLRTELLPGGQKQRPEGNFGPETGPQRNQTQESGGLW